MKNFHLLKIGTSNLPPPLARKISLSGAYSTRGRDLLRARCLAGPFADAPPPPASSPNPPTPLPLSTAAAGAGTAVDMPARDRDRLTGDPETAPPTPAVKMGGGIITEELVPR